MSVANKYKYCKDCAWSEIDASSAWMLNCIHPDVAGIDHYNLGATNPKGVTARDERRKLWYVFPACGKAGKLYEQAT